MPLPACPCHSCSIAPLLHCSIAPLLHCSIAPLHDTSPAPPLCWQSAHRTPSSWGVLHLPGIPLTTTSSGPIPLLHACALNRSPALLLSCSPALLLSCSPALLLSCLFHRPDLS